MHRGLSECLSPISLLRFGKSHPERSSKHPGLFCSGKTRLLVLVRVERSAWYRVERMRDALRTMARPSQGLCLSHPGPHVLIHCVPSAEASFLAVRVLYVIVQGNTRLRLMPVQPREAARQSPTSLCGLEHAAGRLPEKGYGWVGQVIYNVFINYLSLTEGLHFLCRR